MTSKALIVPSSFAFNDGLPIEKLRHVGSATLACRRRRELEAVENLLAVFVEIEDKRDRRAQAH